MYLELLFNIYPKSPFCFPTEPGDRLAAPRRCGRLSFPFITWKALASSAVRCNDIWHFLLFLVCISHSFQEPAAWQWIPSFSYDLGIFCLDLHMLSAFLVLTWTIACKCNYETVYLHGISFCIHKKKNMGRERRTHLYMYMYAHESTALWFFFSACKGQEVLWLASLALRLIETDWLIHHKSS